MFNQSCDAPVAAMGGGPGPWPDDDDAMAIITSSAYSLPRHTGLRRVTCKLRRRNTQIGKHVSDRHGYAEVNVGSL